VSTNRAIVTEKEKPVGSVGLDKLIAAVAKPKVGAAHSGSYR